MLYDRGINRFEVFFYMKHATSSLRKRNKIVLFIVIASIFLYMVLMATGFAKGVHSFPWLSLILCATAYLLYKLHIHEKVVCAFIVMTINVLLVHTIYESVNVYSCILLVLALFVVSIYQSAYLNGLIMIVFAVEVGWFIYLQYPTLMETLGQTNLTVLLIILAFLCATSLIQGYYFSISYRNIETKNDRIEKEFLSREGYLKLFFENAKDSMAVFDLNNDVIAVNPAFEKLYGWDINECIGKQLPMVSTGQFEESRDRMKRMLEGESFDLLETVDMRRDGTTFDAEVTLSPIFNNDGEIIATSVITRDISYRKEAEKLLLQSEKLNFAQDMAASVAHEIRNPLTVISGFTQMMQQDPDTQYAYFYSLIDEEIKRIDLIIHEFLILAQEKTDAKPENFDVHNVLKSMMLFFKPNMQAKKVDLDTQLTENPAFVNGHPNKLRQVFINIFKNALEAIGTNGTISVSSSIQNQNEIRLVISDSGCGMPKEVAEKIFEPFFTTKEQGTGLGMMITHNIIQEHKGKIHITSEPDFGTTITITLPLIDTNSMKQDD